MNVQIPHSLRLALVVCVAFLFGCIGTETTEQGGNESAFPKTMSLSETVTKADSLITQISDGFAANDMDKAHDPLHQIGHVLEGLPALVDASTLSDDDKKAVKEAVESLMDNFGKVDAKLHGQDGADFADVKDSVTEAFKVVADKTKSIASGS